MIPSYMSLVPVNYLAAAVTFSLLKCEGKQFKSFDYYARFFFSYLRSQGMTDADIYRHLGRIGDQRKGNAFYAGMNSKQEYRHAIHVAIQSEGNVFIHPLDRAAMQPLMFPTVSHRYDSQRDNQHMMFFKRDNKIQSKRCNNIEFERKQFIYMCGIELYCKQYELSDYGVVFEWLDDMSARLELWHREQEKILERWFNRVLSRTTFFSDPFDPQLARLYGYEAYESRRLIELKEQIKYEAHFIECSNVDNNEMSLVSLDEVYWDEFYLNQDMDESC